MSIQNSSNPPAIGNMSHSPNNFPARKCGRKNSPMFTTRPKSISFIPRFIRYIGSWFFEYTIPTPMENMKTGAANGSPKSCPITRCMYGLISLLNPDVTIRQCRKTIKKIARHLARSSSNCLPLLTF